MIFCQSSFFPGLFPGTVLTGHSSQFMQYPHIFPAPSNDTREQPGSPEKGQIPQLLVTVFYRARVSGSGRMSGIQGQMRTFTQDPKNYKRTIVRGSPSQVKGDGFRVHSRRGSPVRIRLLAFFSRVVGILQNATPGKKSWQTKTYPFPGEDSITLVQGISYFYSSA